MTDELQLAAVELKEQFNAELTLFAGQTTLNLESDQLVGAARLLRDQYGFEMLVDLTAVDYWPQAEPRFHLVYQLYSMQHNLRITLRTRISGINANMDSVIEVWASANWFERELFDMFGIRFNGHPDMRRLLMPADWQGHPLRKDYPTGYEEVQFTFNLDEIDLRKPYAKE